MLDKEVAEKVEEIYKDQKNFVMRYNMNADKVFRVVAKSMKVVPYDLKYVLHSFYKELTTSEPDNYVA